VPYGGGFVTATGIPDPRGEVISVDALADAWVERDGCAKDPETTPLPNREPDDDSSVVRRSWDGCDSETAVVFSRVEGGGHTWPSGPQYLAEAVIGPVNRDLAASEVIWEFFAEHPKA
jgi:polyhydroxybutyrate depolymerase